MTDLLPAAPQFSGTEILDRVVNFIESYEEDFAQEWLRVATAEGGPLAALLEEFINGDITAEQLYSQAQAMQWDLRELNYMLEEAFWGGGQATAVAVGLGNPRFTVDWGESNPWVAEAFQNINVRLVGATQGVNDGVATVVAQGVRDSKLPREIAAEIYARVGLLPSHAIAVDRFRDQLVNSGASGFQITSQVEAYTKRLRNYRARMVGRTEVASAVNAGQHEFWRRVEATGMLPPRTMRVWITAKDELVCPECGPLNDAEAPIGGTWLSDKGRQVVHPPAHPHCRCTTGLVFHDEFGKLDPYPILMPLAKHAVHEQKDHGNWARGGGQLFDTEEVPLSPEAEKTRYAQEKAGEFSSLLLKGTFVESLGMYVYDEDTLDKMYLALEESRAAWNDTPAVLEGASAQFNWYANNERAMDHAVRMTKALGGLDPALLNGDLSQLVKEGRGADLVEAISDIQGSPGEFTYWNPGNPDDPNNGKSGEYAALEHLGALTRPLVPATDGYIDFYGEVLTAELRAVTGAGGETPIPSGATSVPRVSDDALGVTLGETLGLDETVQKYLTATGESHFRRAMKSSIVDRLSDRIEAESPGTWNRSSLEPLVDDMVQGWAQSAASERSAMLQHWASEFTGNHEAFESFGGRQNYGGNPALHPTTAASWGDAAHLASNGTKEMPEIIDSLGRAVYAETQALLAATGVDDVLLYRGMSIHLPKAPESLPADIRWDLFRQTQPRRVYQGVPGSDELKVTPGLSRVQWGASEAVVKSEDLSQQPISSWATHYKSASSFSRGSDIEVMQEARVPRSQVFSTAMTGLGAWIEDEVITFDAPGETRVVATMDLGLLTHRPPDAGPMTIDPDAVERFMGSDLPVDGDGDGWVNDDSDNPIYVGVRKGKAVLDWSGMLNWLPPEELPGWNVALVEKHAVHEQLDHGNWARSGGWESKYDGAERLVADLYGNSTYDPEGWPEESILEEIEANEGRLTELNPDVGESIINGLDQWCGNLIGMNNTRNRLQSGMDKWRRNELLSRDEEQALNFYEAVRTIQIPAPTLYRGIDEEPVLNGSLDLREVKVGDTLGHFMVSSFSEDPNHFFVRRADYKIVLKNGTGFPTAPFSEAGAAEGEWLVTKDLKVTDIRQEPVPNSTTNQRQFVFYVEPVDGDGDGKVLDGTPQERMAKAGKVWDLTDVIDFNLLVAGPDVLAKHAVHEQKDHGNWARGGSRAATGIHRFTQGAGELPGKRLFRVTLPSGEPSWVEKDIVIDLGIERNLGIPRPPWGGDEWSIIDDEAGVRKVIMDALNEISPELRPDAVVVGGFPPSGPPVGGAHYSWGDDTITLSPMALPLTEYAFDNLPGEWSFKDAFDSAAANAAYRQDTLRQLVLHEAGHGIDDKIHERTSQWKGPDSWRSVRNKLANTWFQQNFKKLDPDGETTWYLYQNFNRVDDWHTHAPAELFAEHFAYSMVGKAIPGAKLVNDTLDDFDLSAVFMPRDGDGDGTVFDGTDKERPAMTSMNREVFLALQKRGLTFEDQYMPPEMAPDDLAKHAVHNQEDHGNWARGVGRINVATPGSGKKGNYDPAAEYRSDHATAAKLAPEWEAKVLTKIQQLPGFGNVKNLDEAVALMEHNVEQSFLKGIADPQSKQWREWYPIGNEMGAAWAAEAGVHPDIAYAIMARLSPQAHWDANMVMAEETMRILDADPVITEEIAAVAIQTRNGIYASRKVSQGELPVITVGKRLSELSPEAAAHVVRGMSEDEGVTLPNGQGFRWQSELNLARSVDMFRAGKAGSYDPIDDLMGVDMKIRSFYNNLRDPHDTVFGEVTVDTHAVGIAIGVPVTTSSREIDTQANPNALVSYDGTRGRLSGLTVLGTPSSLPAGVKGAYPLIADAYRNVAARHGLLPREVQSVTWEQHRQDWPRSARKRWMLDVTRGIHHELGHGPEADAAIEEFRSQLPGVAPRGSGAGKPESITGGPTKWANQYGSGYVWGEDERQEV